MAYSRNKYKLLILKHLPKNSKLINRDFYKSLKEFLKEKNFFNEVTGFYLNRTAESVAIIAEFETGVYLAIKILEETTDKDSIQTKDEIFYISEVTNGKI